VGHARRVTTLAAPLDALGQRLALRHVAPLGQVATLTQTWQAAWQPKKINRGLSRRRIAANGRLPRDTTLIYRIKNQIFSDSQHLRYYLDFASHKFAVDARREGCRCISILQAFRNEADAAKSCDLFFANKSIF